MSNIYNYRTGETAEPSNGKRNGKTKPSFLAQCLHGGFRACCFCAFLALLLLVLARIVVGMGAGVDRPADSDLLLIETSSR